MTQPVNDNLVLIAGKSATGKSACLAGLQNPERLRRGWEPTQAVTLPLNTRINNVSE